MAQIDFGGVVEEVITADEFPLQKAREVLGNETVAVLGYGVQGPGQALNMRDNGIRVIIGQREGGNSWERALADGFVPGETLFPIEEAARMGTVVQFLLSDAGQVATWPAVKQCLNEGDALYFSQTWTLSWWRPKVPAVRCAPIFSTAAESIPASPFTRISPGGRTSGRSRWASPWGRATCSPPLSKKKCTAI